MKPTEHKSAAGSLPEHPTVAYETQDAHVGGVERAGLILAGTIVLALVVVGGVYALLMRATEPGTAPVSPQLRSVQTRLPPPPQMQGIPGNTVSPPEQQREFQAAAAAKLNSYGWVDEQKGFVHIPITEAMKRIAEKGLPEVSTPAITKRVAAPRKGK